MVKQPADHSSEFQMSNEDFPALPGAPAAEPGSSNSILESVKLPTAGLTPEQVFIICGLKLFDLGIVKLICLTLAFQEMAKTAQARKGIQTSPDGELTTFLQMLKPSLPFTSVKYALCTVDVRHYHAEW